MGAGEAAGSLHLGQCSLVPGYGEKPDAQMAPSCGYLTLLTMGKLWNLFSGGEREAEEALGWGKGLGRTRSGTRFPSLVHHQRGLQVPHFEALAEGVICQVKEAPEKIQARVGWGGAVKHRGCQHHTDSGAGQEWAAARIWGPVRMPSVATAVKPLQGPEEDGLFIHFMGHETDA